MSARQLKKLRMQDELARKALEKEQAAAGGDDSAEEEEEDYRPARPKNAFAAFAALDDGNDGDDDDDDEDQEPPPPEKEEVKPAKAGKKKKKGKKGKKETPKAEKAEKAEKNDKNGKNSKTDKDASDTDSIDKALQELGLGSAGDGPRRASFSSVSSVETGGARRFRRRRALRLNAYNLKVSNELRNMFGAEVIAKAAEQEAANRAQDRRQNGRQRFTFGIEELLSAPPRGYTVRGQMRPDAAIAGRNNPFMQFKETWPRATSGGLSMRQVRPAPVKGKLTATGVVEYAFVHSDTYIATEEAMQTMVLLQTADYQQMVGFLALHPYHVTSLILVSAIARTHDQNASLAIDLLERALFSFGRSGLSGFRAALLDAAGCRARLSFRRPENRQFVLCAHQYIVAMLGRGTYVTALEWCKVVLALLPGDEYGVVLHAQTAAVLAWESAWLVKYLESFDDDSAADPSEPSEESATNVRPMLAYVRQSLVPAKLQLGDVEGARAAVRRGAAEVPWLYGALFQAGKQDVPRAVWGVVARDATEDLYTSLYVRTAGELWTSTVLSFVKAELDAMGKVDPSRIAPAAACTQTIARFVYLTNDTALMGKVTPSRLLHTEPNYDFDPLPPAAEANVFSYPSQKRPWAMADSGEQGDVRAGAVAALQQLQARIQARLRLGRAAGDEGGNADDLGPVIEQIGMFPDSEFEDEFGVGSDLEFEFEDELDFDDFEEIQAEARPARGNGDHGHEHGHDSDDGHDSEDEPAGVMPGAWQD